MDKETSRNYTRAKMSISSQDEIAFFSGLAWSVTPHICDDVDSVGVSIDGALHINPAWFNALSNRERAFVLIHEVMHLGLEHHERRGGRDPHLFNVAIDLWINTSLSRYPFISAPEGVSVKSVNSHYGTTFGNDVHEKYSAESIYSLLKRRQAPPMKSNMQGDLVQPDGEGEGKGGSGKDEGEGGSGGGEKRKIDWPTLMRSVHAMNAGFLPGNEKLRLGLEASEINWRAALSTFFTNNTCGGAWSFRRPNRRVQHMGITLPSMYPDKSPLAFAADVSGSTIPFANKMLGHIIKCQKTQDVPVRFMAGDTEKRMDVIVQPNEKPPLEITGGGGTKFKWIFEEIRKEGEKPAAVIILTDGHNFDTVPKSLKPRSSAVLWVIYGNRGFKPPFGKVIHIKEGT